MGKLTFSSKLTGMGKEFLLQTSADPKTGKGASILYEGGNPVDIMEFSLADSGKNAAVVVEDYHRLRQGKLKRLCELYDELAEECDAPGLEMLAVSLLEQKLFDEAAKILEKAVEMAPHNSRLLNYLGLTCIELGDYPKAQSSITRALELSPEYPDYHNNLGVALLRQGRCVQAAKSFQQAIESNIYFAEPYYNLALTIILNGIKKEDYDLSRNLTERASSLLGKSAGFNPAFNNGYLQQGLEALKADDLETAYRTLSKSYEEAVRRKFRKKTYNLQLEYLFRNDFLSEEAVLRHIRRLQKKLEEYPHYPDLHNELGLAYTVLAQFHSDRAIRAYQKALELNPKYKAALKNLKLVQNELKGLRTLLRAIMK